MKYKIIAICGEAGSGKDTLLQQSLASLPLDEVHEIISCTTRPMREREVEGVNYYYLTPKQFTYKVLNNEMLEATVFNDQFYGTSFDSLRINKINLGVFNPDGIRALLQDSRIDCKVVRVVCSDKVRISRQLNREENPDVSEIIRRYEADRYDFADLDFEYIEAPNDTIINLDQNIKIIANIVQEFKKKSDNKD